MQQKLRSYIDLVGTLSKLEIRASETDEQVCLQITLFYHLSKHTFYSCGHTI